MMLTHPKKRNSLHLLFIVGYVGGESKRYRVYNILEAISLYGMTGCAIPVEMLAFWNPKSYDAVIFFRCEKTLHIAEFLKKCKTAGIPTIYDVDDLVFDPDIVSQIHALQQMNPNVKEVFINRIPLQRALLDACDYATAPTQYLCDYMTSLTAKPAFLIRNSLNEHQMRIALSLSYRNASQDRLIGFLSGTKTHDKDFAQAAAALEKIMAKYPDVMLIIVGPIELPDSIKRLGNRVQKLPYMDYRDLLRACSRLYAVIVPLEYESAFCNAKSELKYFEQALVGVPVIASPTAPYRECITHGVNGLLAKDAEEWENALSQIIEDADFRDMLARNAKEHIKDIYCRTAIGAQAKAVYSQIAAKKKTSVSV
jgi:glycosyltransferase involved in cell wall biosynthesis